MNGPVRIRARRQRGIAAVELAATLTLLVPMLALSLFLGRVLMNYTALQKATHDAVRYLASVPTEDIRAQARSDGVMKMANNIIAAETAELNSGQSAYSITILCDDDACAANNFPVVAPANVTIKPHLTVTDIFLPSTTAYSFNSNSLTLTAPVTFPFMGN